MYMNAFDKSMYGRAVEDMSVELSIIFEDRYMSNVQLSYYFCSFFVFIIMAKS